MDTLLSIDQFRKVARDGAGLGASVFRLATGTATEVQGVDRTLRFCFSDGSVDRAGDSIDPKGWQLEPFLKNPVALWAHNSWDPPIGRASGVGVVGSRLMGNIEFAPPETYAFADTIYQLTKGGYIKAVSVGFNPLEWTFTNDKSRPYGIDFTKQELLEISPCPVPCNGNALAEARAKGIDTGPLMEWAVKVLDEGGSILIPSYELDALRKSASDKEPPRYYVTGPKALTPTQAQKIQEHVSAWLKRNDGTAIVLSDGFELKAVSKTADWMCGASHDLPIDDASTWDGPAAEASIFDHAGGDDFDPAEARKGFLVYDASAPKLRGSYKLPFAMVVGGELKAVAEGVRAAASRLPQTDIPDTVKTMARAVLDGYEAKIPKTAGGVVTKGGRRISKDNMDLLTKAMGHIQSVMDSNDPDNDGDDDLGPAGQFPGDTDNDTVRLAAEAAALKEKARALLAPIRAAQDKDLTH